jgi:hypothetical protein
MKARTKKHDERRPLRPVVVNVRTDRAERPLPKRDAPGPDSYARFLLNRHRHAS